jgi:hypothetical protein
VATACRCGVLDPRPRAAGHWSWAMPPASSIRSPATACTRHSSARGLRPGPCSASLDGYTAELTATLGPMMSASWGAKIALDRYPRTTFLLGRTHLAWRVMERLLEGEIAAPREARGLTRVPLKAIAALGRRAGDPSRAYMAEARPA